MLRRTLHLLLGNLGVAASAVEVVANATYRGDTAGLPDTTGHICVCCCVGKGKGDMGLIEGVGVVVLTGFVDGEQRRSG